MNFTSYSALTMSTLAILKKVEVSKAQKDEGELAKYLAVVLQNLIDSHQTEQLN